MAGAGGAGGAGGGVGGGGGDVDVVVVVVVWSLLFFDINVAIMIAVGAIAFNIIVTTHLHDLFVISVISLVVTVIPVIISISTVMMHCSYKYYHHLVTVTLMPTIMLKVLVLATVTVIAIGGK